MASIKDITIEDLKYHISNSVEFFEGPDKFAFMTPQFIDDELSITVYGPRGGQRTWFIRFEEVE